MVKTNLVTIANSLSERLGAKETARYVRQEDDNITGKPLVHSIELRYHDLPSESVVNALKGLTCVRKLQKSSNRQQPFHTHDGLYYYNGDKAAFRLEVRRRKDRTITFYLTSMVFNREFYWLTEKEGQVKMRSDKVKPEVLPENVVAWLGVHLKDLLDLIGPCGSFVGSHHGGMCIEAVTTTHV